MRGEKILLQSPTKFGLSNGCNYKPTSQWLVLFSLCESVCVSSQHTVVLVIPIVVGTTTEAILIILLCSVFIYLSVFGQFCQCDCNATVQDAVIKLYRCVAESKMSISMGVVPEIGRQKVAKGPLSLHFMPLAHINSKLQLPGTIACCLKFANLRCQPQSYVVGFQASGGFAALLYKHVALMQMRSQAPKFGTVDLV